MTVTSPLHPTRAGRRSSGAHAARSIGAFLAAAALLIAPLAAAPAMAATAPTPSPTTTNQPTGITVFTLSPVAGGIVRPGDSLAVSVTLQNGTDAATPALPVSLELGTAPLTDRAALTAWLGGDISGVTVTGVGASVLEPVAGRAELTNSIVVAPEDPALAGRAPGVYPLVASYPSAEGTVKSTSAMIVPSDAAAQNGIGVVVPITASPRAAGLLTPVELTELTSPTGALTTQLDAVEGTAAILAVDPAIVAAIRVLGTAAPATASEWLTQLQALPNSRFALQFGDADVAAQLEAGQSRPQRPTSLQYAMDPANFIPGAGSSPTPTAAPTVSPTNTPLPTPSTSAEEADAVDPAAPVYPTVDELLDIGDAQPGIFWPATGTSTPSVVSTLGGITVEDTASLTLVSSRSTAAGAAGETVPAHARAADADVLVYDTDISGALHDASVLDEGWLRGARVTAATAYLAFAATDNPGATLLVSLEREPDRSRVGMRSTITTALEAPGFTAMTLTAIAATPATAVEIADAEPVAVRADAASALFAGEATLSRFSTIIDDPTLLTGPERAQILQLLGVGWIPQPEPWSVALAAHRATTATTLDSVGILPPTTVNLISAGAPLPVWVRNDLPYPVNVVLYATPDDLRLDVQEAKVVTAGLASNTLVQVPVQARIGSGQVNVEMQLRSRTYEPIGAARVTEVNVRADWEGIGIVILAVLVGAFIVLGIVRTILRVRPRTGQGTHEPGAQPEDSASAHPR